MNISKFLESEKFAIFELKKRCKNRQKTVEKGKTGLLF